MKKVRLLFFLLFNYLTMAEAAGQVSSDFSINYQFPNCSPTVVTFVNNSTGLAPLKYEWNFGMNAGVNSTQSNPSTTYDKCGNYTVTLTVTNANGQKSTKTKTVTTNCEPEANFTVTGGQGCLPSVANFTSTSLSGSGTIVDYVWDFGDGYGGTGPNPTHTYNSPGCKTVTLVITNSNGCIDDTTFVNAVCTNAAPVADFTSTNPNSCYAPLTIDYTQAVTGTHPPFSYKWSFPGGNPSTSTAANPSVNYSTPGFYNTELIVTDSKGCSDTLKQNNYVLIGTNIADFQISTTKGCTPLMVYCDFPGYTHVQGIEWTAVGSSVPSGTSHEFQTVYTTPGTYQICASATYPGNCVVKKCTTITVGTLPIAAFTVTGNNPTCSPPLNNVRFTNTSTGTGTLSYAWKFPGGSPSTSSSATPAPVNYGSCGNFNVTLIVTNSEGCADTLSRDSLIKIDCPIADVTSPITKGCLPFAASFNSTGSTGAPVKWWWNFGDSTSTTATQSTAQNPTHVYTKAGCFSIRLIIENALKCRDTLRLSNFICTGPKPDAAFSATPTVLCAGSVVTFTNLSTGIDAKTRFFWDFKGSPPFDVMSAIKNPTYTYSDTGVFDVAMIASNNGCNDTINIPKYIKVKPPVASFYVERSCFGKDDVTLHGEGSIGADTYSWSIPGGSPSSSTSPTVNIHFNAPGDYEATLTVTNLQTGCSNSVKQAIAIRHVNADFNMQNKEGCAPFKACLENLSTDAAAYQWYITTQTGAQLFWGRAPSPCPTILTSGVYNVMLIATDVNNCSDTIYRPKYFTVYGLTAKLSGGGQGCAPITFNFKDLSTSSTSIPVAWNWDFGDPGSGSSNYSTLQNPSHAFTTDGNFQIVLAVTDNHGCVSSVASNTNGVTASKPVVQFTASDTSLCLGNPTCFVNQTAGVIQDFTYVWDFGDNTPLSTVPNPCHTYTDTGLYTVKLIAKNWWGCKDTVIKNKYIRIIAPHADFIADSTATSCPPLQVHFTNLSLGSDTATKWLWDFGDGSTSTAKHPFHIYTKAGKFDVKLKMTTPDGCSNTLTFTKYIQITGPTAIVTVTPQEGCSPLNIHFQAQSANTIYYIWNFGDGSIQQVGKDSISYTYVENGIYLPKLILNDGLGCVYGLPLDSIKVSIPSAGFRPAPNSVCNSGQISFTDTSHSVVKITQWNWSFGDPGSGVNNTSVLQNPTHTYSSPGTYIVNFSITDRLGCTSSKTDSLVVHPNPKAGFTSSANDICPGSSVQFTESSVSPETIVSYKWNFNDPASGLQNTATGTSASHTFALPGNYLVKMSITTIYGCTDSIIQAISVRNFPVANAGPDKSICIHSSVNLTGTGGVAYAWSPASSLNVSNTASVTSSPLSTTTYTLTVTDNIGCTGTDRITVTVLALPVINAGTDKKVCKGLSTILNASGGVSYVWTPSSGLNNATLASPNASPNASTTYALRGTDANGCINYDTVVVAVLALPAPNAGPDAAICLKENAQLNGTGGESFVWTPASSLNFNNISNPLASPTITTSYIMTVTDTNGCKNKDTVTVTVKSLPVASAGFDKDICINFTTQLDANGGTGYSWSPQVALSNATIKNPVASPTLTTTYTVAVTGANGCSASDVIIVSVHNNPAISAGPDKTICYGTSAQLNGTGGSRYTWTPSTGLNNSTIASPKASPTVTTTYIVTGASTYGCINKDTITVNVLAPPPANAGNDAEICYGETTQLQASGGISYQWSPAGSLNNSLSDSPIASPLATTNYIVTVTDNNQCTAKDTVRVIVHALPAINAGHDVHLCEGSSALLQVIGGVNYLWSPTTDLSSPTAANPLADPMQTVQYVVEGNDDFGCVNRDTVIVNVIHPFVLQVGPKVDLCEGSTAQLFASGAQIYNWLPVKGLDNPSVPQPYASPNYTTNYQVIASDGLCFADTGYVFVEVHPLPDVYAGKDAIIVAGDQTQLSVNNSGTGFIWSPADGLSCTDCTSPFASPDATTTYTVSYRNDMGCEAVDSVIVFVGCPGDVMYIPNAFTPDNDGSNDKFFVRSQGLKAIDYIRIYDRWGELIFETMNQAEGWDGTLDGKPVVAGVYVYYVQAICTNGETVIKQGNITLIR